MALVLRRGHGGDNGPPDDDRPWKPPPTTQARKRARDGELKKTFRLGGKKKLPIKFDVLDQKTVKPVGENNHNFTGLIGNEIERVVPFYFKSWEDVPDKYKTTLWPTLKHYFDLAEHLTGSRAKDIEARIKLSFKARYKSRKHNFHQREFVGRDGYIEPIKIRDFPPRRRGIRSLAQILRPEFPDLVEQFKKKHTKAGKWNNPVAKTKYLSGMYQQLIAANILVTQPAPLDPHQFVGDEVATGPLLSQEAWARAFTASQDQLSALYQQ
ncbi:hypothetical protein Tco_0016559 [Tanacetum coccineum]